jgi:hypothetical protein
MVMQINTINTKAEVNKMHIRNTEFMRQALTKKRKNWGRLALACLACGAILGFIMGKAL